MKWILGLLKSKTFWLNAVTFLATLALLVKGQDWVSDNPALVAILGQVVAILNIIVRILTVQSIPEKGLDSHAAIAPQDRLDP